MRKIKEYRSEIRNAFSQKGTNLPVMQVIFRLICWVFEHHSFSDFFMLKLNKKGTSINQILSIKEFAKIHNKLNPPRYRSLLEDKYVFDRFLSSFGFPLAQMIGYIANSEVHWLNNSKVMPLDQLINCEINCFIKSYTKWGGLAVHKLNVTNKAIFIDKQIADITALEKLIQGDLTVLQQTVVQHPELCKLSASSVNTIRLVTIHDGNKACNFFGYIRMGIGNSLVDNISHGGLGCGLYEDGTLFETAHSEKTQYQDVPNHPTTGVVFGEINIPFYKEALELVTRMHDTFHCFFIIGWDIAITDSGPVVIEGNPVSNLIYEQQIFGGLKDKFISFAEKYHSKRNYLL
jgi:hypothetical protein